MDHIMGPRMTDLLKKAAKAFKLGMDPFSAGWLQENEVTADQCMSLSDIVGATIEWFADQGPNVQAQVLLHGFHPEIAGENEAENP